MTSHHGKILIAFELQQNNACSNAADNKTIAQVYHRGFDNLTPFLGNLLIILRVLP